MWNKIKNFFKREIHIHNNTYTRVLCPYKDGIIIAEPDGRFIYLYKDFTTDSFVFVEIGKYHG